MRHPAPDVTTESLLVDAFLRALAQSGLERDQVDGIGVASFSLSPDHVADLAWRLGVRTRWLMEDTNGGASALNMLQHAIRAVEAGDARSIVLLAGDRLDRESFRQLVDRYNRVTTDYLSKIPFGGPNSLFAFITRRHMDIHGLQREDYGRFVVRLRQWAERNPGAVYRDPLTLEEYLCAPVVAEPLHRYDCVPVVSGADAVVVAEAERGVAISALAGLHNLDGQLGDGVKTGLSELADELWAQAGFGPMNTDAAFVYDDYPAMALIQLDDLGFIPNGDVARFVRESQLPVNTSGGQLSAGQAGAAGGMHGLVEAVNQLLGRTGTRSLGLRRVVVTGYGMVAYRHGVCANAAVLETS